MESYTLNSKATKEAVLKYAPSDKYLITWSTLVSVTLGHVTLGHVTHIGHMLHLKRRLIWDLKDRFIVRQRGKQFIKDRILACSSGTCFGRTACFNIHTRVSREERKNLRNDSIL